MTRQGLFLAVALGGAAALAAGAGGYVWYRSTLVQSAAADGIPEPPKVELAGYDSAIVASIEEARQAVLEAPRSAKAWGRLGMVLAAQYFPVEANRCWVQAEKLDPREPRWPYYQGIRLWEGDPDAAIPKLERAVELWGNDAEAPRLRLAETLLGQGRPEEAEKHFQRVVKQSAINPRAHLGLARLQLQRGKLQQSLEHLIFAEGVTERQKGVRLLRAEVLQRLGNAKAAEQELRRAADLPKDAEWPDPFLEEVAKLQTGPHVRTTQAGQLLEQGKVREAIVLLQEAVRDYPQADYAWFLLGKSWLLLKEVQAAEKAEEALRVAVQRTPHSPDAQFYLGCALLFQGQHEAAAPYLHKAVELKPDHADAYYCLSPCLVKAGDRPGAIKALRTAVSYKPQFGDAHLLLGELLAKAGDYAEAEVHLRHAIRLSPNNALAKTLLEQVKHKQVPPPKGP